MKTAKNLALQADRGLLYWRVFGVYRGCEVPRMPKMKTHKGLQKRIKVTARGKVRHKKAGAGHLMSGKSGDRGRRLRRPGLITGAVAKRIKVALGE